MLSKEQAQDLIEELALSHDIETEDIISVRRRIPSDNPHITPLLEELAATYFLTDEVLEHYSKKLYELAQK